MKHVTVLAAILKEFKVQFKVTQGLQHYWTCHKVDYATEKKFSKSVLFILSTKL